MSEDRVHLESLESGLRLLSRESRSAPVVELEVWADVGSADEREGESGLAHFHEHMLFKGTERRGTGDVAGDVEGAGGRINAYTSFDVTVYHATLPASELETGLDVLADAVLHSVFDPAEIEREIEVVLEEIRRSEDSPGHVLGDALFATAYREHPYRRPILGSAESVARIDRARLRAFYERWYGARNLCVVAVGDFAGPELRVAVERAFAGARLGGARRERPAEPPQRELRTQVLTRPFERVAVELAAHAVDLGHKDAALADLLAFVLGGGDSSRLVRGVKERDGLAERIDASCYTPRDPGLFSVSLETDGVRAEEAVAAASRELARLCAEPVTQEELDRARANLLAADDFERESVTGQAQKLGSFHHLAGGTEVEERYLAVLRAATPADLQRVAVRLLAPERLTACALLPEECADALDDARLRDAVRRGRVQVERAFSLPARAPGLPGIESYELAGGTRLHVVPRREVPVVAARAAFLGGLLAESVETSGLSAFLASMWLRGTRSHSAADFARSGERLAAEIDGFSGRSSTGLTLEAPSDRLTAALDLFTEVLLEPAFDAEEIERERRDTLAAIDRREDRLAQRAFQLFAETHFATHPYRRPLLGSRESVEAFDAARLETHHRRLVGARELCLAVAGDVDPDDVAARFSARLAELPERAEGNERPADEPPPREIRCAELHKERAQAHLVIGFRGLTVRDPDRFALEVITQLLAGQAGRLFLELRDKKSLAYAVNAANVEGLAPGTFCVYIATAPEKLAEARESLLAELRRLLEAPPDAGELERARRYLIGNHQIDQQRNAAHAAHAALDALYGLGPAASREFPERVAAVGPEDALRVARRVIDLDAYTLAVVQP